MRAECLRLLRPLRARWPEGAITVREALRVKLPTSTPEFCYDVNLLLAYNSTNAVEKVHPSTAPEAPSLDHCL